MGVEETTVERQYLSRCRQSAQLDAALQAKSQARDAPQRKISRKLLSVHIVTILDSNFEAILEVAATH
jgi:hypothetical protein